MPMPNVKMMTAAAADEMNDANANCDHDDRGGCWWWYVPIPKHKW
jgi:hypothetical protein